MSESAGKQKLRICELKEVNKQYVFICNTVLYPEKSQWEKQSDFVQKLKIHKGIGDTYASKNSRVKNINTYELSIFSVTF